MSTPVSVIIPVYNHEKYIVQALDSVFNQTHPELEVIIIDDGSKDKCAALIEAYLKKYIASSSLKREFTFIKEKNKGASPTINQGLKLAKHPILTILNSDDFFALDRLEIMVRAMEAEKGAFAFSEVVGIDENGAPLSPFHGWRQWYDPILTKHRDFPSNSFAFLLENSAVSTGNLIFTRKLLDEIGPFNETLLLAHDYEFILRAILSYEPLFLRKGLYFYRQHSSNTITNKEEEKKHELFQFIPDFLVKTTAAPPNNKQAPSPWNFPTEFAKFREDYKLDRYLSKKIAEPELFPKNDFITKTETKSLFPKVTVITHQLSFSGAPKVAFDVALALKNKGYQPTLLSLADGPLKKFSEKNGIPVAIVPNWAQPGKQVTFLTKLMALIGLYFYLVTKVHRKVIVNSFAAMDAGFPLGCIPFLKRYWYIHESLMPATQIPNSFKKWGMRLLTYPGKYTFLFGSKNAQEIWAASGVKGKVAYWSGLPATSPSKKEIRPIKNILAMGSIEIRKGMHIMVEAFIKCIRQNRIPADVVLTIVGFPNEIKSPYQGDLVLKVLHEGMQDRIKLTRAVPVDCVDQFFEEADLFAMSSSNECLPLVLLMAMSKGLPIVSTTANGCEEAVQDGATGYTSTLQNSDSFALVLEKAINNPAEARKMGQEAQKRFNAQFSLERNVDEFMKVFENGSD